MQIGFDTDTPVSAVVAALAVQKGAGFCCRYLKNLSRSEIAALHAAGLAIVLIFESTARRALGGAPSGATDGARALAAARALGAPDSAAIYATADFDVTPAQEADVMAYFAAFKIAIAPMKFGVYANGAICQLALDKGIANYTWLMGGLSMRDSRKFLASGKATIVQDVGDKSGLYLGIAIDTDLAYADDYGGWAASHGVG